MAVVEPGGLSRHQRLETHLQSPTLIAGLELLALASDADAKLPLEAEAESRACVEVVAGVEEAAARRRHA